MSKRLVRLLMDKVVLHGLAGPAKTRKGKEIPTCDDLVKRRFVRSGLNEL